MKRPFRWLRLPYLNSPSRWLLGCIMGWVLSALVVLAAVGWAVWDLNKILDRF